MATVQPGAKVAAIHAAAEAAGWFYPPDPASKQYSTIGRKYRVQRRWHARRALWRDARFRAGAERIFADRRSCEVGARRLRSFRRVLTCVICGSAAKACSA
ncbi:MAG: hypothetical protein QM760_11260 [Nibricoccus sp.]